MVGGVARASFGFARHAHHAVGWGAHVVVVLAIVFLAVAGAAPVRYVEHEAAIRQTIAVQRSAADGPWMLVGPPEQRIEIGAADHFMDLQQFVARYAAVVSDPHFRFGVPAERLFVFVEKRPFRPGGAWLVWSPLEAADAAWSTYRIPARRADLERRALQLCDAYGAAHGGMSIAYEDDDLRVYLIRS